MPHGLRKYVNDVIIFPDHGLPDRIKAMAHAPLTTLFRHSLFDSIPTRAEIPG
jgi:hypothetical protein